MISQVPSDQSMIRHAEEEMLEPHSVKDHSAHESAQ